MKLYHGTCEDCGLEIYKTGYLEANPNYNESATEFIDELFEKYTGKKIRDNAVYFWEDIIDTDGYDCIMKVRIDNLDLDKLYVGDYNSVNELYHYRDNNEFSTTVSKEEFDRKCIDYINTYMESFMLYSEYIKIKDEYKSKYIPEILYFDKAKIELEEDYLEYFDLI